MKQVFKHMDARIFSYYNEANKIIKGVMPLPRMLNFMPSCLCNHNCPGCDWTNENKTKYVMPAEQWKKVFNELHLQNSIRFVEFCGLGEPMLHPDIHEMILKSGEYGWIIGMITNGTRLRGKILEDLIKGAAFIRISMECGSKKVFDKIKKPKSEEEDGFEAVCRNIKEAVKLRNGINPDCNIDYKFTVGKENHKDIENAISLAIELGCDAIQFKAYRNVPSELDDFQKGILDKRLQDLKEIYKEDIIVAGFLKSTRMENRCFMTPIHVLIDCYGDSYACCYFRHRPSAHKLGNFIKDGFQKLWFDEKHFEIIKNIDPKECAKYDCKFFEYNRLMDLFMIQSRELDII